MNVGVGYKTWQADDIVFIDSGDFSRLAPALGSLEKLEQMLLHRPMASG